MLDTIRAGSRRFDKLIFVILRRAVCAEGPLHQPAASTQPAITQVLRRQKLRLRMTKQRNKLRDEVRLGATVNSEASLCPQIRVAQRRASLGRTAEGGCPHIGFLRDQ
jgi:hypothetical protein